MEQSNITEMKIIEAATHVFLEKGKEGARMQEISEKAGINKALLHYYFRSKEKLFEKVFYSELRKVLNNILDSINNTQKFETFLKTFIDKYINIIAPRKNLLRFILWESENQKFLTAQTFHDEFSKRGYQENPILLKIKDAVTNGEIKKTDPVNLLLNILSMCIFPLIAAPMIGKILQNEIIIDEKFLQKRKKEIFKLVWDAIKP